MTYLTAYLFMGLFTVMFLGRQVADSILVTAYTIPEIKATFDGKSEEEQERMMRVLQTSVLLFIIPTWPLILAKMMLGGGQ